jgi:hypothetical protein
MTPSAGSSTTMCRTSLRSGCRSMTSTSFGVANVVGRVLGTEEATPLEFWSVETYVRLTMTVG